MRCICCWRQPGLAACCRFLYCLRLAKRTLAAGATYTMMRFPRYDGHLCRGGRCPDGDRKRVINSEWLAAGHNLDSRMLQSKCALVAMMVVIALVNRYVVVPRMVMAEPATQRAFSCELRRLNLFLGRWCWHASACLPPGNLFK